jgi:hypothetical protein
VPPRQTIENISLIGANRGTSIDRWSWSIDSGSLLAREPVAARTLTSLLGDPKWKPTFSFRIGFPTRDAPPSPRRDVMDVLM